MSMETLTKSIKEAGKKEIEQIKKEGDAKVKEIIRDFESEAKAHAKKILENSKSEAHLTRERVISNAKIEARQMADNKKNKLINSVFEKASKKILGSSDSEKKKILESLANQDKKGMKDAEVFVDKKYSKLLPGAKTEDIGEFGVIVRSADGKTSVANTLSERMEHIKSTMRHEVAKVLFR